MQGAPFGLLVQNAFEDLASVLDDTFTMGRQKWCVHHSQQRHFRYTYMLGEIYLSIKPRTTCSACDKKESGYWIFNWIWT